MADEVRERYHLLLSDFRAKKLPDFYRKYNTEQSSGDNSSFTAQHKDSDLFPQTQPIEKFLEIPGKIRKRRFFEDISVGHIVEGLVTDKWADTLNVRIHSVYYGPKRWIRDLKIKGECDLSEFKTHSGSRRLSDSISDFDLGDHVRGVISFIDKKDWKLTISFRRSLLPDHLSHTELGAIEDGHNTALNDDDEDDGRSYIQHLRSLPCFENPEVTNNLLRHLGINTQMPCSFLNSLSSEVSPDEFGYKLRERQSTKWSMDMVANGVKLFKENKHDEAMKCFDQSLQMHPKNVEALVARGALKANQSMFKTAITDFREALEIQSTHRNGRKYLCETLTSLAKQYEKDRLWKEASRCYKEALEIDPNQDTARERIHQIRIMLSQQVLAGKRKSIPDQSNTARRLEVAAGKESLQRSKSLIELLKKKVSKKSKKKKRKKLKLKKKWKKRKLESRSCSDASSTDSEDDDSEVTESASEKPTSESDDEWVEKSVDDKVQEDQAKAKFPDDAESHNKKDSRSKNRKTSLCKEFTNRDGKNENREASANPRRKRKQSGSSRYSEKDSKDAEKVHHVDSPEYAEKEGMKRRSHETVAKGMDRSSSNLSGENFSRTHFSNDEISFVNSLLRKKSSN